VGFVWGWVLFVGWVVWGFWGVCLVLWFGLVCCGGWLGLCFGVGVVVFWFCCVGWFVLGLVWLLFVFGCMLLWGWWYVCVFVVF
jgi:hypothetical protein